MQKNDPTAYCCIFQVFWGNMLGLGEKKNQNLIYYLVKQLWLTAFGSFSSLIICLFIGLEVAEHGL